MLNMTYSLALARVLTVIISANRLETPQTIPCAVMPVNMVEIASATKHHMYSDYNGRRYFFCCGVCPAAFKGNPAKFATRPSIAIPR